MLFALIVAIDAVILVYMVADFRKATRLAKRENNGGGDKWPT